MQSINSNIVNTNYISFKSVVKPALILIALAAILIVGAVFLKKGYIPFLSKATPPPSPSLEDNSPVTSPKPPEGGETEISPALGGFEGFDRLPASVDRQRLQEILSELGIAAYQILDNGIRMVAYQGSQKICYSITDLNSLVPTRDDSLAFPEMEYEDAFYRQNKAYSFYLVPGSEKPQEIQGGMTDFWFVDDESLFY